MHIQERKRLFNLENSIRTEGDTRFLDQDCKISSYCLESIHIQERKRLFNLENSIRTEGDTRFLDQDYIISSYCLESIHIQERKRLFNLENSIRTEGDTRFLDQDYIISSYCLESLINRLTNHSKRHGEIFRRKSIQTNTHGVRIPLDKLCKMRILACLYL
ncbi:hypothetical protein AVEN_151621-1 [Araneus ventricosus]|uniref:Uncharacterized protein n=1 Tax=Araneus ventricosus TaxID=182803 RepID=A0A4Y1ZM61_ARAVE|nr:hypothetical protein AVEN_151621-1 [Araneus ventricosus]